MTSSNSGLSADTRIGNDSMSTPIDSPSNWNRPNSTSHWVHPFDTYASRAVTLRLTFTATARSECPVFLRSSAAYSRQIPEAVKNPADGTPITSAIAGTSTKIGMTCSAPHFQHWNGNPRTSSLTERSARPRHKPTILGISDGVVSPAPPNSCTPAGSHPGGTSGYAPSTVIPIPALYTSTYQATSLVGWAGTTGTVHRISRYTGCKPAHGGRCDRKLLPRGTGRPRLRRDSIKATLHVASALFRVNSLSVYAPTGCILLRRPNDGSYPVTGKGLVATTGRNV